MWPGYTQSYPDPFGAFRVQPQRGILKVRWAGLSISFVPGVEGRRGKRIEEAASQRCGQDFSHTPLTHSSPQRTTPLRKAHAHPLLEVTLGQRITYDSVMLALAQRVFQNQK